MPLPVRAGGEGVFGEPTSFVVDGLIQSVLSSGSFSSPGPPDPAAYGGRERRTVEEERVRCLLQELERCLGTRVCLCEHRSPGLHEGIPSCELSGFLSDIHIDDATVGGFEIALIRGQKL